ncbi:MAG: endonuclease/exonuclease/phosphatase family protein, partial [Verrucomicrobiales bacterium]|nr:endonuclease/exonuclease/phosphatase family protein [Verrucomicrobiales bacterium]
MKNLFLKTVGIACMACAPSLPAAPMVRVMTFNASMNRDRQGELLSNLQTVSDTHLRRVTEIIQHLDPDILLINEFDLDPDRRCLELFQQNYLSRPQRGESAVTFPYAYAPPSNTGIHSGHDLDGNGIDNSPGDQSYGNDAFGFGEFPEKYAFAVYSKHPIDSDAARTFQKFLWQSMPGNLIPPGHYTPAAQADLRLSSKTHLDLPIDVDGHRIHILAAHPTPPTFDGSEDRNGRRNHDEIRLFADYITPRQAAYLTDDASRVGGLPSPSRFVIMGDMNADPVDGDSRDSSILQILENPAVNGSFIPMSPSNNADTAVFGNGLRVDYALPSSAGLHVDAGAVFWPTGNEPVAA